MDKRELVKKIKERYGSLLLEIDGEQIEIRPTVNFYEGFLVELATEDRKSLAQYIYNELPKIVKKDLGLNDDEAKWFIIEYGESLIEQIIDKLQKKNKKQET